MVELVDTSDSKSDSSECGFDSRLEYYKVLTSLLKPFFIISYLANISGEATVLKPTCSDEESKLDPILEDTL